MVVGLGWGRGRDPCDGGGELDGVVDGDGGGLAEVEVAVAGSAVGRTVAVGGLGGSSKGEATDFSSLACVFISIFSNEIRLTQRSRRCSRLTRCC